MDGWSYYIRKKVFIVLRNKRQYSGVIDSVEDVGNGIIFISLKDKFGKRVTFVSGEVELCQEEGN